jgi:hypothetical protein
LRLEIERNRHGRAHSSSIVQVDTLKTEILNNLIILLSEMTETVSLLTPVEILNSVHTAQIHRDVGVNES